MTAPALRVRQDFTEWFLRELEHQTVIDITGARARMRAVLEQELRRLMGRAIRPSDLDLLDRRLFDLADALALQLTSPSTASLRARLERLGLSRAEQLVFPEAAWRLGALRDWILQHPTAGMAAILDRARIAPLVPAERAALQWVQLNAARNLRTVFLRDGSVQSQALLTHEIARTRDAVAAAIGAREHPLDLARRLWREREPEIQRDMERVARTEIAEAHAQGFFLHEVARGRFTAGLEVIRIPRPQACRICKLLFLDADGTPRRYQVQALIEGSTPLIDVGIRTPKLMRATIGIPHPQDLCVISGTCVGGATVRGSTTRQFTGGTVTIRTSLGHSLTCTPNHPTLTPRGWVAASLLHEGDYVACQRGGDRLLARDVHDQQMPSRIEDMAGALRQAGAVSSVPVPITAEHFHGDGGDSEVAVVRADGQLWHDLQPSRTEHPHQPSLRWGDARAGSLASLRAPHQRTWRRSAASEYAARMLRALRTLRWSHARAAYDLRVLVRANVDTRLPEASHDGRSRDAQVCGECQDRLARSIARGDVWDMQSGGRATGVDAISDRDAAQAQQGGQSSLPLGKVEISRDLPDRLSGEVALDRVVHVRRDSYRGTVHNLITAEGFYLAGGIVVHNCSPWMRAPQVGVWGRERGTATAGGVA